jgi:hypothetical protein
MAISADTIGDKAIAAQSGSGTVKRPPVKRVVIAEPDPREIAGER